MECGGHSSLFSTGIHIHVCWERGRQPSGIVLIIVRALLQVMNLEEELELLPEPPTGYYTHILVHCQYIDTFIDTLLYTLRQLI